MFQYIIHSPPCNCLYTFIITILIGNQNKGESILDLLFHDGVLDTGQPILDALFRSGYKLHYILVDPLEYEIDILFLLNVDGILEFQKAERIVNKINHYD